MRKRLSKITVFVAEDHPIARTGICEALKNSEDILLIGETDNGIGLKEKILDIHPNILLLDLKMPNFSPSELTTWIRENVPETDVLVLTSHDRDAYLSRMIDSGASGYLDKSCQEEQLINAIRQVARNKPLFSDEQLARSSRWQRVIRRKWESLTSKERDILRLLCNGNDNKSIANLLCITNSTVETHVNHLLKKLDVESRLKAVNWFNQYKPTDYDDL
mgnify:CR=1 FL=1